MPLEQLVDPAAAALVIVDMQNDFCHPDGAQATMGSDVHLAAPMAQRLKLLLAEARAVSLRTIFVRTHHSPWTNSDVWLGRGGGRHAEATVPLCLPDSWGADFSDGLEPRISADSARSTAISSSPSIGTAASLALTWSWCFGPSVLKR